MKEEEKEEKILVTSARIKNIYLQDVQHAEI